MKTIFYKSLVKTLYKFTATRILKIQMPITNSIGKRKVMDLEETSEFIQKGILSGKPFMVARYGGCENDIIASYNIHLNINVPVSQKKFEYLCTNAGFFPRDITLVEKYVNIMEESAGSVDLLAIWNWMLEDYIVEKDAPNAQLTFLGSIEPWFSKNPWSKALKGKKVLVVHPFSETIASQYKKREILFANNLDILPEFDLQVYKSVQSIAGNIPAEFRTWFDALEKMKNDIEKIDFDVAIIGCGAYGFPLAHYVKKMGKQAVHLAGATQLLFGIKGSRWEQGAYADLFKDIFNENWVRPSENEKINQSETIEGACYW